MKLTLTSILGPTLSVFSLYGQAQAGGSLAPPVPIDRFSDQAGHLFKRSNVPELPAPNAAIDFDSGPFITRGIGPEGVHVGYYNFDVQPRDPAKIYVFFRAGADAPVDGQLNIVDVIPGDTGYSDFWNVVKVIVPEHYVANSIRSVEEIRSAGLGTEETSIVVNCPVVPAGSTAQRRYNGDSDTGLHQGYYKGGIINYFNFSEKALTLNARGLVPISPIYVTFNKNPDPTDPTSGPASGFVVEASTGRTHNVVGTTPEDQYYSPLWNVNVYDNHSFESVTDLESAVAAPLLAAGVANVNCPIVE
ncbi:MAG: hypothetical protein AB7T49_11380 [Oligoflexales bacterium]